MSCFERQGSFALDEIGTEIFDGVVLERRATLTLCLSAFAALSFGLGASARADDELTRAALPFNATDEATWGRFIAQVLPLATELVRAWRPDEDEYLQRLDTLIDQVERVPPAQFETDMAVSSAYALRSYPVTIMQFRFEPWAVIRCHDHREYNGILKVIAGKLRVRSFEDLSSERAPVGEIFHIRETEGRLVGPGERSHLSRTRNNLHYLRAQAQGAQVLDVFTFFQEDGRSVYLDVKGIDDCTDCSADIYEARWLE